VLFFFTEADFWAVLLRLHRFSKKNICRPAVQQTAASSPSMYGVRSKLNVILS